MGSFEAQAEYYLHQWHQPYDYITQLPYDSRSTYWAADSGISGGSSDSGSPTASTPPLVLEELGSQKTVYRSMVHNVSSPTDQQYASTSLYSQLHGNRPQLLLNHSNANHFEIECPKNKFSEGCYIVNSTVNSEVRKVIQYESHHHSDEGSGSLMMRPKKRNTANKKERRRTQSINNAFADLRDCIPNVPVDTKLSKIKTLRLAASYIGYLMAVLETDEREEPQTFCVDFLCRTRRNKLEKVTNKHFRPEHFHDETKKKCRTGWPQHMWALELKNESSSTPVL